MTNEQLQKILERAEAATPGPWDAGNVTVGGPAFSGGIWEWTGPGRNVADALFIASARTDVPALVAEVRRLKAALGER